MMGKRFARIVEECLHRLDRGENLPDVLLDYPAEAEQLKPLLLVAMASRSMAVPLPDPAARIKGRNQMLLEMDQVGSSADLSKNGVIKKFQSWAEQIINASRSRGLIRPAAAPGYRMALIVLVVIFGSGWFVISASASPGQLLQAITEDFQQVLAFLNRDPTDNAPDYLQLIDIYDGAASPFAANRAAKVVFLRDLLIVGESPPKSQFASNNPGGSSSPNSGRPVTTPGPVAGENNPVHSTDDSQGPGDLPVPCPHPASSVVNEVVSDTAKEKNPVWDQLPFNQSDDSDDGDPDATPICDDADDAEDKDKDDKDKKDKDKKDKDKDVDSYDDE